MTHNQPINKIKDLIYETEGLLELLQLRPEKLGDLAPMILARIDSARAEFAEFAACTETASATPEEAAEVVENKPDTIVEDADFKVKDADVIVEEADVTIPLTANEEEEDRELKEKAVEGFSSEDDEVFEYNEDDEAAEEDEPAAEEDEPAAEVVTAEQKSVPAREKLPAFCLNDRYRFRRAIFGGSEAEFNSTMKLISTLPSYAAAEEFFTLDMGLDKEDEDVADFFEIIKNYFGE